MKYRNLEIRAVDCATHHSACKCLDSDAEKLAAEDVDHLLEAIEHCIKLKAEAEAAATKDTGPQETRVSAMQSVFGLFQDDKVPQKRTGMEFIYLESGALLEIPDEA